MQARATVLVVDDHPDWRAQAKRILQVRPEWHVIAEAADGAEAVRKAIELQPDVIILDIGMPTLNGLAAARRIRERCPRSRIVFLTQDNDPDVASAASAVGHGYVRKTDTARDLLDAIVVALRKS